MLEGQQQFEVVEGLEEGKYNGHIVDIALKDAEKNGETIYYMALEIEEKESGITSKHWFDVPYPKTGGQIRKGTKLARLMERAGFNFDETTPTTENINDLFWKREIEFFLSKDKQNGNGFLKINSVDDIKFT